MCTHRLANQPDGLVCTRTDPHTIGHTYTATNGSHVDDRHPDGGHG